MADNARAPWISIVLAGLLAFVVSMAVIAATVAGYAFAIAIKANGPPDPHKISAFASRVPPMLGPFVLTLLVLLAARWVVRRAYWEGITTVRMYSSLKQSGRLRLVGKSLLVTPVLLIASLRDNPEQEWKLRLWFSLGVIAETFGFGFRNR